jgi:hypothetical protein
MQPIFKRTLIATCASLPVLLGAYSTAVNAADHGDAPVIASDRGADVNDCFAFQDPNNNNRTVLIFTVHGFIPSG